MIRLLFKVPTGSYVACSGGSDSMAVLDFLRRGNKIAGAIYFDHMTDQSSEFLSVVKDYCDLHGLELIVGLVGKEGKGRSLEAFWSESRNKFFKSIKSTVVTAHNLDDAVEWWIFTSLRGNPKIMPSSNQNILRPFLTTKKIDLQRWADKNNVKFLDDKSNRDTRFTRNFIRHTMMKDCLVVNPGIQKTIFKKIVERQENALEIG